jgi:hypothetical protein
MEAVGPDSDRQPRLIEGRLQVWWVEGLDYAQTLVDNTVVEPNTIELVAPGSAAKQVVAQRHRVSGSPDRRIVRAWSTSALPFEPRGRLLDFRSEIRTELAAITGGPEDLFTGMYVSSERRRSDLENDLTYNVGLGAFRGVRCASIRLTRVFARPSPHEPDWMHYYRWSVAATPTPAPWKFIEQVAGVRAQLPGGAPRTETTWLAMRSGHFELTAKPASRDEPLHLAISVGLDANPIVVLKPLVDGVVAGLQTHRDIATLGWATEALAARLGISAQTARQRLADGAVAINGDDRLLWPRAGRLQWNPADDRIVWLDVETRASSRGELEVTLARVAPR